jgi:dehydrogenase/reductase SDR family protein 1
MAPDLKGYVAVVTGASRGIGKGIALGLGETGATVYVTGRTIESGTSRWPGTITQTADEVTRLGGKGIAVRCDHADDAAVAEVFAQVQREHGQLDLLVNNATSSAYILESPGKPFWEQPLSLIDEMLTVGLRSYYVASVHAARLMIAQQRGLIINISSGGAQRYSWDVAYGVGKAGVDKLSADMAHELQPHNVTALSLWPPFSQTEEVLMHPEKYDASRAHPTIFTGRLVAAIAADVTIIAKTGKALRATDIAQEYGVSL